MKKTLSEKHRMKYLYIPLEEIHHTMGNNGGRADYGVTPVIATLLILALTLLMTGIIVAGIMQMGNPHSTPIAGITISDNFGVISLAHFSGDTLPAGQYVILVNGVDQTQAFHAENRDFSPGTTLTWDLGITQPLHRVTVVYTGTGESVVIADKQFYREGGVEVNAAFTTLINKGTDATTQVKTGVGNASHLPGVIADQADIWVALDSGSHQADLTFTAEESSADMAYSWTSGNGQTADIRAAEFIYNTTGLYTVRLDIQNTTSGDTGTSSKIIAVRDPGVTALTWVKRNSENLTGVYIAKTRLTGVSLSNISGGWLLQYDTYSVFRINFKVVFTNSTTNTFNHIHSGKIMVPGTWYHTAGVVNQSGTNTEETLRIYVNGEYPTSPTYQGDDPTGKKYLVSADAGIHTNLSFNISSYSEVPFPLSDVEIKSIYNAEKVNPR
ncbi:MAG: type IV pilin [Methanocorpusculum sp.]|nr:type IV pilin [Methanocorpusculum sp.]